MKKQRRVWAIYYKIRLNSDDSWRRHEWVGPCGVYIKEGFSPFIQDFLCGRPLFFRTRASARQITKELSERKNISWNWIKYKVEPFTLSWEKSK